MICSFQRSIAKPNTLKLPVDRSLFISVLRSHLRVSILIVIRRVRSLERASEVLDRNYSIINSYAM